MPEPIIAPITMAIVINSPMRDNSPPDLLSSAPLIYNTLDGKSIFTKITSNLAIPFMYFLLNKYSLFCNKKKKKVLLI